MKLKNLNGDKTQIQMVMNLKTQIVTKLKNSYGEKTQKHKFLQNLKTQIVTNSNS